MSEPVDIKIAHINKAENVHNVIDKELVFEIFGKLALSLLNGKLAFKIDKGKIKKIDI